MNIAYGYKSKENRKYHFVIKVRDIRDSNFVKISNFEYHLLVKEENLKAVMVFKNSFAYFVKRTMEGSSEEVFFQDEGVKMSKQDDDTYILIIGAKEEHANQDGHSFYIDNQIFRCSIDLGGRPLCPRPKQNKKQSSGKGKESKNRQEYIQKLKESYAAYEEKVKRGYFTHTSNSESDKKRAGIYKAKTNHRLCSQCIHMQGSMCVYHRLKVKRDDSCRKFRPYQLRVGGRFSPR